MHRSLWLLGLTLLAACATTPSERDSGVADAGPITGCGVVCDDSTPCTGNRVVCLPSASGGSNCKPETCPDCPSGKFCSFVYSDSSCEPAGCTSAACGFNWVGSCDDCIKANCCSASSQCANDTGCKAFENCLEKCATDACRTTCEAAASATAISLHASMISCFKGSCSEQCFNTYANGCPLGYPVACAGTTNCCPSAYPVCGGNCGQACCATNSTSAGGGSGGGGGAGGGGSGTPTCSPNCTSSQACVNFGTYTVCESTCSSNSQCSSGCCAPLANGSSACLPSSYCGSSGGGSGGGGGNSTCHSLNGCTTVTNTLSANGSSCTGSELDFRVQNNCGVAEYCRVCPTVGGVVDESRCEAFGVAVGGQTSTTGQYFCRADGTRFSCAQSTDPTNCVQF